MPRVPRIEPPRPQPDRRDRSATASATPEAGSAADDRDAPWIEPPTIVLEITDVLDLHSFPPREVASVVRDYLDAAYEAGLRRLRIIHGRGIGVQRKTVRRLLDRDPRVTAFGDAEASGGGWGATWAHLE